MYFTQSYIDRWCEHQFTRHLALLKTLAAIPAPSKHEQKRAEFIRNWLMQTCGVHSTIDDAWNVVVPFGDDGITPFQVVMAHTDVVFPDTDPLPVREENGLLYAPGVGDDTANVAALMLCVDYLSSHKIQLDSPVLIVFNSCEEGLGNLKGVRQIAENYAGRIRELVSFDCGFDWLVERAVGSLRWEVSISTAGGHSYGDFGKTNAIAHLSKLICNLYCQNIPEKENTTTTFNVGTIQGGTSVNTIAQNATMTYECRSDDRECLEIMEKQFFNCVHDVSTPDTTLKITQIGIRPCGCSVKTDAQYTLLNRCEHAIISVTGKPPRHCSASTDANIPLSLGIPAATFGLYRGGGAHTREEYVEINSLTAGLKIALRFLLNNPA